MNDDDLKNQADEKTSEEVDTSVQNETHIEEPTIAEPEDTKSEPNSSEPEVLDKNNEAPDVEKKSSDVPTETSEEPTSEEPPILSDQTQAEELAHQDVPQQEFKSDSDQVTQSAADTEAEKAAESVDTEPTVTRDIEDKGRWYVVHTFSGHENRVAATLKQRIDSEHLENKIFDILVPTQDKIEIRGGKKENVKEKIFPGYILIKMVLDDESWLAVRTTQGVTSFVGAGNKPTPITNAEVNSIVKFTSQGAQPTFKEVFMVDDTVKIIDGPFADFIGKVDSVDTEKGRLRVLVSIFGRETPVELDFLQVTKL